MSYRSLPLTSKLFQFTALTVALTLAACGGGDGDTVDSIAPKPDLGVQQPGTGGSAGSGGGEQAVGAIDITEDALYDTEDNIINSISLEGGYYKIKVVDNMKNPVINAKVTFDIDAEGVELTQTTSGSVLTDSEGVAQIFLKPSSAEVSGAYIVSATANYGQQTATSSTTFAVQATDVSLSKITSGSTNLPSGGQTPISMKVTDGEGKALSGILVNFNSSCGQLPEQVTSDSDGMVQAVFKAINMDTTLCSGSVRISATAGNAKQSTNLIVAAAEATSIIYTSNDVTLGIRGSGSSSTGQAEFTVYSGATTLANERVRVSLEKSPLGLTFGPNRNKATYTATTDANGQIVVPIFPGTTPGPVEIEVTLVDDPLIKALSKNITVASSRVTQDGLSISFGTNALDWSFDGDETSVVARMVDRNGNAVPDGTVINFTTEGGKVSPASCATNNGVCEVTFSTQNPRPGDGRVSVLAVAEGEKAYIDMNENNAWDEGVDILVHNIGDTFRDDNENGTFEKGEFTYPLTTQSSGICENNIGRFIQLKFPTASDIQKQRFEQNYISEYVSPNKPMTCNSGLDTVVRFQSIQLLTLGQREAKFSLVNANGNLLTPEIIKSTDTTVRVRINSSGFLGLNPMPSGTTISGTIIARKQPTIEVFNGSLSNTYDIKISNLSPNKEYKFTIGDKSFTETTTDKGVLIKNVELEEKPEVSNIVLTQPEGECKLTLESPSRVPDVVNTGMLGQNIGTISKFSIENCQAGDKFKVSATSPSNNTSSEIYTIQ